MNIITNLPDLSITAKREEFKKTLLANQVVILLGPTGCGKTTQAPIFALEMGAGEFGIIGVAEPRRIAALSLTEYVQSLLPEDGKRIVGGKTRFWNTTTKDTKIKFMTDGILLEEMLYDPELLAYSVIFVDEAHERGQNVDFILGLLKRLLPSRPDLRVVIASATIDAKKFSKFFGDAPIVEVTGRTYPVKIRYSAFPHFGDNYDPRKMLFGEHFNPRKAPEEVAQKIIEIDKNEGPGDILAFLPGKNEIAEAIEYLRKSNVQHLEILPTYGHMDMTEQGAIFQDYPGKRKVIIATNVAETSITPVGVRFIVDSGLIKMMNFHAKSGRQSLRICPHSQSGCDQRAGRAGRTQDGICYRLYTEQEYNILPLYTKPELCRQSLASVVLTMRYIGIEDIKHFEFIDAPPPGLLRAAYETLHMFGALDKNEVLTPYGKLMAKLPLDPYLSHMLLTAKKYGCVKEIATIAAFISASNTMLRPPGKEEAADVAHRQFESKISDALTFLTIWNAYLEHAEDPEWCFANFLNEKAMMEVRDIRRQLLEMLAEFGIESSSTTDMERVLKTVTAGLIHNLFKRKEKTFSYQSVLGEEGEPVFIHPGSSVHDALPTPQLFVAGEVVRTTREYARMCSQVLPEWLHELFPEKFSKEKDVLVEVKSYSPVVSKKGAGRNQRNTSGKKAPLNRKYKGKNRKQR